MGYRIHPLVAAMAIAFSGAAFAQSSPQIMDAVKVTAQREAPLPNSTGTLNTNAIAGQRAYVSDTAQLLTDVPGVSLYGAGAVSSLPVIHGLADDRLRISVDGMDLIASCPNHMNPPLSYLNPGSIGKLSVYAGITPVSVGGDSIGGSIVAETLAPEFASAGQGLLTKGEIGGYYRSNNKAIGANVSASAASENFNVTYTGGFAKADNYRAGGDFKNYDATGRAGHTLSRDEVGSSAFETKTHTLGFAMKGGNHLVEAKLGYQEVPEQLYPNQRMDMLDNTQKRFNLRYLGQFDWGKLEAQAYHENVTHFMNFGADKQFAYGDAPGMPMHSESHNTGFNLKTDVILSQRDLLRVGGLYQSYRLDDWWPASGTMGMGPGSFENIKDGQRDRTALFGEVESRFSPQWMSLFGVRFERVASDAANIQGYNPNSNGMGMMVTNQKRDGDAFNALNHQRTDNNWELTALGRYTANVNSDIEFGFARKVRSPNLYERYTWSTWAMAAVMNNFVGDGNGYVGNVDLKPEKAHTLSATFDWHGADQSWGLKATPYYTRVTDYIDAIKTGTFTANQFNVLQYANQSARLYGLDLSAHLPLASSSLGEFGVKGLINYAKGKNRDTGDDLYNIMPLNAKATLTHKLGGWDNALEFVAVKGKDNVSDVRNEVTTAGYGLTNLRTSYSWKQVRLDFGVENLFDKHYASPLGGAYVGQGATMGINSIPWGTAVPGMGRSIYAGFNLKF
ncbi:MAG: TonB-dependent receptor [Betaproteobacteria bacterium HGW-Betaproteobacteria-10]|nr:MAG: TonB-dependent receptor [Betaproteobacteria bacterium HGW-Betaproteobacteria-10]